MPEPSHLPTPAPRRLATLRVVAIACGLFVFALLPRVQMPATFVTVDEAYHWFDRVETFQTALEQGDYARTNLVGHPGVTTLWLGTLGRVAHQHMVALGWIPHADSAPSLSWALLRLPVGVVAALCVVLAWGLLRQVTDRRVALLAALFLATDPFLVAHSQLLHLDALLTSFVLVAVLAAYAAFCTPGQVRQVRQVRWPMLAVSAVAGGLAFLTKSPSVLLLPVIGLISLVGVVNGKHVLAGLRRWLLSLLAWGSIAAVVWVGLWPAAWLAPFGVLAHIVEQALLDGGSAHGWGNYFLGHAVDDPGPLFYPVAVALRTTPWTLAGLLVAAVVSVRGLWLWWRGQRGHAAHVAQVAPIHLPGVLALFALLFLLMMSIPPKKFDRYALPVFPVLSILAAWGLVGGYDLLRSVWRRTSHPRTQWLLAVLVSLGLAANLLWYHPYELAYYNPLLGGGTTAVWAIPVGWGEGYEQAGAFISSQPDGCDRAVASWFAPVLRRFLCNHWVVSLNRVYEPGKVDYAVLYRDQLQRQNQHEASAFVRSTMARVHTVTIHSIEYASVYRMPRADLHRSLATVGPSLRLMAYRVDTSGIRASGTLSLTLQWHARAPVSQDYMLFVHVLDASGQRVGQVDVPPGGPSAPTSSWQPDGYVTWTHPIPVPPDIPPGTYWVTLGVYNPQDWARLMVSEPAPPDAPDDGGNVLVFGPLTLP